MTRQAWAITRIEPTTQCRDCSGNAMLNGDCFEAELLRGSERHVVRVGITNQAMTTAIEFLLREGILDREDRCVAGRALVRANIVELLESQPAGHWEPTNHRYLTIDSHNVSDLCKQLLGTLAVSE